MRIEYYVEFGRKAYRLSGVEKFEREIENFIFNTFIYNHKMTAAAAQSCKYELFVPCVGGTLK